MKVSSKKTMVVAAMVLAMAVAMAPRAEAASFRIDWTGSAGYTMTGLFGFSDALLGTGVIDETQVTSFRIEGFLNAVSVGSWDFFANGLVGADTFNLNFNTTTLAFVVGGFSSGPTGQDWGVSVGGTTCQATGFGFSSGSGSQGLCVGVFVGSIPISQPTLTATAVAAVPEPATLLLLGTGLGAIAARRRTKKRA